MAVCEFLPNHSDANKIQFVRRYRVYCLADWTVPAIGILANNLYHRWEIPGELCVPSPLRVVEAK